MAKKILLICPPFQHTTLSSIAVAGMATWLREHKVDCEEAYLHLELMRIVGKKTYDNSVERRKGNVAELLFAEAMHGDLAEPFASQLTEFFGDIEHRRNITKRFGVQCLQRITLSGADIIGFSTSYNQLSASLFLSDLVKRNTTAKVVLGGTACTDVMGAAILKAYPFIDYVVSGFGEQPLLDLCNGHSPTQKLIEAPLPPELTTMSLPDFRHFRREAEQYGMDTSSEVNIQYQSSRGCWWGQKRHCTFCGIHRSHLSYEAKPVDMVVGDIRTLHERYGQPIMTTDAVLSLDHLRHAIPQLARFYHKPWLFYELKVNLTEPDITALANARVIVQMGIETLSTRLMKAMQKGASAIRAIAALKWSRERHLDVRWNLLYKIPQETVADYREQIGIMKKIPHLQPPRILGPVHIDRFSPYFDNYRDFGWTQIHPAPEYRAAHPHIDDKTLFDLAYHFEGEGNNREEGYWDDLEAAFNEWHQLHKAGDGLFLSPMAGLHRIDGGEETFIPLTSDEEAIIGATHQITPVKTLIEQLGCTADTIRHLVNQNLLFQENKRVVNLAVRTELPD
ncbi:MAG: RiPP maturation radical SAM C-methyltransferase [Deltaproteobacteria bacterium]|nr:RiPP maturation radical SAM C-methyltransferase [Deltaproteobacteria bacterium]